MGEPKRAADRQHRVADLHGVAVCQPGRLHVVGVDLHRADVGAGIGPEPRGPELTAIVEADRDVAEVGAMDHMTVGDHHRAAGHLGDHARARLLLTGLAVAGSQQRFFGIDMHDCRPHQLRKPPQLGGLPFEILGVAGHLLIEPLTFGLCEPGWPQWIDLLADRLARLDRGQPHRRFLRPGSADAEGAE